MKIGHTLRVHNAMVTGRMQTHINQLRTALTLGRKVCLQVHEDRNSLAFHYIESGAFKRFSACHRIVVSAA